MGMDDRLTEIAKRLKQGQKVSPISVREFLGWFGAQRRGSWVVYWIRRNLDDAGLTTEPDFESAYIDSKVNFALARTEEAEDKKEAVDAEAQTESVLTPAITTTDPTYRISKLAAANNRPISTSPDATVAEAVTLMMANDFSQLPVMTNDRDVKGILSWTSIGSRLALGKDGVHVRELMDTSHEMRAESSLFQAIPIIVEHQYVLVRGPDNRITGIVTASDLSLQFQQLAEPFLLLGEIENHIRRILGDKFSAEELNDAKNEADIEREVNSVADLTFGEYIRLLESNDRWSKVNLPIDRKTFCRELEQVRRIRNDVMHFDPDGIAPDDLERLRDFVRFLQRLQSIGVS